MNSSLPADLLKLKARFEAWRKTRSSRIPIPDELRREAIALLDRYSASMICRVCRLHPRSLKEPLPSKPARQATPTATSHTFFPLPAATLSQATVSTPLHSPDDCQLLLERPDGARLTLTLPALDPATLSSLCSQFLRS